MLKRFLPFLITLVLVGCSGAVKPPLPDGEQTITGVLKAAELSAVRRGSHLLLQEGVEVYYAESSLVNLREFQGKRTTLRGVLEHNTDPEDLPVLVVQSVVDVEETTEEYDFSGWGLSFRAPIHWQLVKREGRYRFYLEGEAGEDAEEEDGAGEETGDPILVLWQEAGKKLPDGGVPIVVDATRATRLTDELSGTQIVAVKRDKNQILTFRFTPGERLNADRLREDFLELLASVELTEKKREDPTPAFGTGSLGQPCGGAAGILCPDGFFCDVQTFDDNVGKCRKL